MMNNDEIKSFQKLLRVRTIFKQIGQLSWNISKLEQRFPVDSLTSKEIKSLANSYKEYFLSIQNIYDELKDEFKKTTS